MGGQEDERKKRLAEALRENLRKRKAQARGDPKDPASFRRKPESMNTDAES